MDIINKNTMELPINLNMVDADSLYSTDKVFSDADNCIVDNDDTFRIFCKIKFDADGYPHELEEGDIEYDSSSMGLIVETCEQLIWACCGGLKKYTYQGSDRIFPPGVNKLYILLKGDNFHFQNDRILRAGFNGVSGNDGNSNKGLGGLFTEKYSTSNDDYYRHKAEDEEYYLYPYQKNTQTIVQGLQITGTTFMQVTTATKVFINNIYFKDCVFTCTANTGNVNALAFYAYPSYNGFLYFNNCKLSIHCRVFENTQRFDSTGIYWNNCSRYIEFSDLNENAFPPTNRPFYANTTQCSTKVKNFAYNEANGTRSSTGMIANSLNSSWDIECYVVKFQTDSAGAADILNACINCDVGSSSYRSTGNNNLFIHLKVLREIKTLPDREEVYTFGYSSGVTIFCVELPPGSTSATYIPDSSAKRLTVSECKDYNELNKWGFFVNQRVANND